MIAAWMLYSLAVGLLVGLAALAADRSCRMLRLPRRGVWFAALAATVLLSGFGLLRQATPEQATSAVPLLSRLPSSSVTEPAGGIAGLTGALLAAAGEARAAALALLGRGYAAAAAGADRLAGSDAVVGVWATCTATALLLLVLTLMRVRRARRSWRGHRIGGVAVLLSEGFGPAVVGLLRPAIVVPSWLLSEPPQAQRVIVEHEEEHRRAKDQLLLAAACLGVCLLPWNLALWWLLSRLRLAVELDCDDRMLRRGVTPLSYGSLLLEIAGRAPTRLFGAPALADSRIHLERRLLAMTQTNRPTGWARPAVAALAALLLVVAACGTDVPTAAAIEDMDAAAAEQQARHAGLLPTIGDGRAPLYIVDGKVVPEAEARTLAPDDIAAIEVLKRDAAFAYGEAGANGVIRMKRRVPLTAAVAGKRGEVREGELVTSKKAELIRADLTTAKKAAAGELRSRVRSTEAARTKVQQQALQTRIRKVAPADVAQEPAGRSPAVSRARVATPAGTAEAAGGRLNRMENPFIVIDGAPAKPSVRLPALASDDILSVEVLKGEEAVRRYGARAANGAVVITTRKAQGR